MKASSFFRTHTWSGEVVWTTHLRIVAPLFITLCATLLWSVSLKDIDPRRMTDLGLVSVLPPTMFVALTMMIFGFCLALIQQRPRTPVLLVHSIIFIFMLYGITSLVEAVPRSATAHKLVGIMDFIMQTGRVDPKIDAFFNWPGFFILSAFVTEITGLQSPLSFAGWAPVFFNLIYLGPLIVIFQSGTDDQRLVWLAVLFFYLTNWIGQDYLAPQALNYFLYLVILAILLAWFKGPSWPPNQMIKDWGRVTRLARVAARPRGWLTRRDSRTMPGQLAPRVGLMAIIVTLFAAMVMSHQLTPFAILSAVTALIVSNRVIPRGLPILMAVMIGTWISFATVSFLSGHTEMVAGHVGAIGANINANLMRRFRGSPDHLFILHMRVALSAFLWSLALLGGFRRLRAGYWDLSFALLAAAPFTLLGLQAYGGELLLRIYLFTLPFMAFFAAALFFTLPTAGRSWQLVASVGLLGIVLVVGFYFTRYGNERMYYFTTEELEAVQYFYSIAEPGSQLIAVTGALPWRFQDYRTYKYVTLKTPARLADIDGIALEMGSRKYPAAYLILTRSQKAYAELFAGLPSDTWERFENALMESEKFEIIFANADAKVFVLANTGHKGGR